jgi:hypothetical protein
LGPDGDGEGEGGSAESLRLSTKADAFDVDATDPAIILPSVHQQSPEF